MSYEKQTWQTGDIITAVKLNHMEDGIANPGYTVETKAVAVVPEQSVVTEKTGNRFTADITIAEGITFADIPDTLTITFQGQEYVCSNHVTEGAPYKEYGTDSDDWSTYPFTVGFESMGPFLATESAGTYTVKATGEQKTVTPSEEFKQAVSSADAESGSLKVVFDHDNSITLLNNPSLSAEEIYMLIRKTMRSNSGLVEAYIKDSSSTYPHEFRATEISAEGGGEPAIKFCFLRTYSIPAGVPSGVNFVCDVVTLSEAGEVSIEPINYKLTEAQ